MLQVAAETGTCASTEQTAASSAAPARRFSGCLILEEPVVEANPVTGGDIVIGARNKGPLNGFHGAYPRLFAVSSRVPRGPWSRTAPRQTRLRTRRFSQERNSGVCRGPTWLHRALQLP